MTKLKRRGLYQSKETFSLPAFQRLDHGADNCKMIFLVDKFAIHQPTQGNEKIFGHFM